MKKKVENDVSVGFDIGIASVGVAVVDTKTGEILESFVKLFSEGSADKNAERRGFRQSRRLKNRRKNRLQDTNKVLAELGFIDADKAGLKAAAEEILKHNQDPYDYRVRGLEEKLTSGEIVAAVRSLVTNRGISYNLKDVADEEGGTDYQRSLSKNQAELKDKTPGQIQLERLQKYGKVRGKVQVSDDETLLNVFPTSAYKDELSRILEKQAEFYPQLTEDKIAELVKILTRKREYYVGPGSEKSRTEYGIYRTDGKTLDNLFEVLIGKDKYFPEEQRAAGNSYTAQYFNMLNDLNTVRVTSTEDGRLTLEQKQALIQKIMATKGRINMPKEIAKVAGVELEGVSGLRIDKDGKPLFSTMPVYRKVKKVFGEQGIDVDKWPAGLEEGQDNFWDDVAYVVSLNTENGEIRKQLNSDDFKKYSFLDEELKDAIIENKNAFALDSNNKWHRFSLKTMHLLIQEMSVISKNQMEVLLDLGLLKKDDDSQKGKFVNVEKVADEIYNPVVRKSVRQALKAYNAVIDKYENISYVVVELPREKNSDDEKKKITDIQKENEAEKNAALKEFAKKLSMSEDAVITQYRKTKGLAFKVRLWYQQNGICPYSGNEIKAEDLLYSPDKFEIDHIIPISVSFNDSTSNKVLCYAEMNQEKGQRTPKGLFDLGKGQGYAVMKETIQKNKRMSKAKKDNLLSQIDLEDVEVKRGFISRNLVDTQYASRVVLNALQSFIRTNGLDTKVTVVRGAFTAQLRRKWDIYKTRETHHHHAKDAAIIAVTPFLKLWGKGRTLIPNEMKDAELSTVIDIETGEIIDDKTFESKLYQEVFPGFNDRVRKLDDKIKFKYQVDKKNNRKVSDATIYSVRKKPAAKGKDAEYILGKIKDIYSKDGYAKFKKLYDKDKTVFLMYNIDPKTFEILEYIMSQYPDSIENVKGKEEKISPFELYRQENGKIRKYSKKGNGPEITSIKYYDSKYKGSGIDITPNNAKNKHVVLQSLNPWRTDVYYNKEKDIYEIMGIKYSNLVFYKGKYGIRKNLYATIRENEDVSKNSEFVYSLYRNDIVKVISDKGEKVFRFSSRSQPNVKNYVEFKPLDKDKFLPSEDTIIYGTVAKSGRFIKKFAQEGWIVLKGNTDELGNTYFTKKEGNEPSDILED